jgi:hypothetical protein
MWKKYGATALNKNDGITSASKTTPFGTVGPTRSSAAYNYSKIPLCSYAKDNDIKDIIHEAENEEGDSRSKAPRYNGIPQTVAIDLPT